MEVLLIKDVEAVGLAGQVVKVSEGYARNFLFPRKLAKVAGTIEVTTFRQKVERESLDATMLKSRVAMLANQIQNLHLSIKEKANEQGKLYGAVGPDEIVELLKDKGIQINRKQVEFSKAIRTTGEYEVIVKLTSKFKPSFSLKVVAKQ
jgi:large subunit ribosomal protein L9